MVKISKSFLKSSVIYTLAGTLPTASAVLLLWPYTKYLDPQEFGALSIYLVIALLVQYLTTYSFDVSLYIHYHEFKHDLKKLSGFVSSAFNLMLLIGLAVGVILVFCGDLVFSNMFSEEGISFFPYGMLAAITGMFQSLFKVFGNLTQSRERPAFFFWINVVSFSLIILLSVIGLVLYPKTLVGPIGGRCVAAVVMGGWALLSIYSEFGFHFDMKLLRSSFSFNFYTFVYQILQWVINHFDKMLMLPFLTLPMVGIYDFAIKCLIIIEFLLNGLHNSFFPKVVSTIVAQEKKQSTPELNRYFNGLIAVIMLLICFCILTFPWAIQLFIKNPKYQATIPYLPYIAATYVFRGIRFFYASPYSSLKHMKPLPVIAAFVAAVKVGLVVLLVPDYSLFGVIAASSASAIVEIVLLRIIIRDRFTFSYNVVKILIAPLFLFGMIIGLEPWLGTTYPNLLHVGYLVATVIMLFWVYRKEFKFINPSQYLSRH